MDKPVPDGWERTGKYLNTFDKVILQSIILNLCEKSNISPAVICDAPLPVGSFAKSYIVEDSWGIWLYSCEFLRPKDGE